MSTVKERFYEKLKEVIPGGVNSPVRAFRGLLDEPLIAEKGAGALITDVYGNSFIDYCGSWGALIHGHACPEILEPVHRRLDLGSTFGATTAVEERLARKVVEMVDSIELVRFVSSGTEATMSALRLARGYTGRSKIIKFEGCYHGHSDMLLVKAGSGVAELPESSSAGVPQSAVADTISLPFNDCAALEKALTNEVAAVILEPVAGNMGVVPASPEFMKTLVSHCKAVGALLIFDEVMTGFRVGLKSAQGLYGVTPDLTCLGKVVGGGFNVAAFGGRRDVMEKLAPLGPVYQAGTLSGNPVAMEAGYQALLLLEKESFYEELERKCALLCDPIVKVIEEKNLNACLQRVGSMFTLFFGKREVKNFDDANAIDKAAFVRFFQHVYAQGILPPPSANEAWFVSAAHTDAQLKRTADIVVEYLIRM